MGQKCPSGDQLSICNMVTKGNSSKHQFVHTKDQGDVTFVTSRLINGSESINLMSIKFFQMIPTYVFCKRTWFAKQQCFSNIACTEVNEIYNSVSNPVLLYPSLLILCSASWKRSFGNVGFYQAFQASIGKWRLCKILIFSDAKVANRN